MNPDPSKLRQQERQTEELAASHLQQVGETRFDSVEELIRFDVGQNPAPEAVAERLKQSIAREPAPPRSWWRRLLGKMK